MPEKLNLHQKLVEVMKSVDNVPKNGFNEFHRYAYPLEADITRAVRGKLAELGIVVLSSVESATRTGEVTEVFTKHVFVDSETGEKQEVKWYGQGADKGDKGAYKAETGAVKYMLLKTFLIPTGDDPEKDDAPPPNGKGNGKPASAPKATPPNGNGTKPNGKPEPPKNGNVSTSEQQDEIKRLAKEVGLDVDRDILPKMKCSWPPDQPNAGKILKRLQELMKQKTATNGTKR